MQGVLFPELENRAPVRQTGARCALAPAPASPAPAVDPTPASAYERWRQSDPAPEFLEWLSDESPEFGDLEQALADYETSGAGDLRAPEIAPVLARIVDLEQEALPRWQGTRPTIQPQPVRRRDRIGEFEAILQRDQMPYVAVDEAKKATFRDARLEAFHFIVYFAEGDNWLVRIGQRTSRHELGMREWQAVFGDGFRAVFGLPLDDGFRVIDLDGGNIATWK